MHNDIDRDAYLGVPVFDAAEACRLALNLARNARYAVFPCRQDKTPATPHGFHDASTDPDYITDLWHRWPGPLIGIATGARSGLSVLDLDVKHQSACAWWHANERRIPLTRAYRTRSGGAHLFFQHRPGVRNSGGKIAPGIDTRGNRGYVIFWFAAGFECIEHRPPAPWPTWLYDAIWPPPRPQPKPRPLQVTQNIAGLVRTLAEAREGTRNTVLYWAANRLRERGINEAEALHVLGAAAADCGLAALEAQRTVRSAWRAAP